MVNAIKANLTD